MDRSFGNSIYAALLGEAERPNLVELPPEMLPPPPQPELVKVVREKVRERKGPAQAFNIPAPQISPYEKMMQEVLAEKRGSIEGIEKQLAEREQMNNSWMDKINLAPAAAWIDSMTGSRLSPAFQGPSPYEQNQAVVQKLRDALNEQKDGYANEALNFFKNKAYMDQVAAQTMNAEKDRTFDQWYKKQLLNDKDLDREAKANAVKPKSFTADQTNAATFGKRALQAETIFQDLESGGYSRALRGESASEYFLPTEWQGENLRKQSQAERNFVNALLRRESGAAISDSEFTSATQQYFPRPGDTPDILAQKRANRMQAIEGLRVGAGPAWDEVKFIDPLNKNLAPQSNAKPGFVRMRKGEEVIDVPQEDAAEAMADGYREVR